VENKGNTRTKKVKRPLKLYISNEIEAGRFVPAEDIVVSNSPLNSDFSISDKDNNYYIYKGSSLLEVPIFKISKKTSPLTIYNLIRSQRELSLKNYNSIKKKKNLKVSNFKKNSSTSIKSLYEILEFKNFILNESTTISHAKELPECILRSKLYRAYNSCQIMIHQKGSPTISAYCFDNATGVSNQEIPVTNYNKIFNLVKKSKNKLFNQSQILEHDIGVVGTFLAKEVELSKHSILIFISRNDFLPPSDIEINSFNSSMSFVSDVFQKILLTSLEKQRSELYSTFIQSYPNPIFLDDSPLNKVAKELDLSLIEEGEVYAEVNGKRFSEITNSITDNTSDIYHHQRVSLLGELLNTLKHELSNPLFGLKMASDLLLLEDESDDFVQTVKDISINSNRCQTIIENFSNLYREENTFELFNISEVIKETILLTKSESKQIPKDINYYNFQADSDYEIVSNPTWVSQIIFNLVINSSQAIKSSTEKLSDNLIEINIVKKLEEIEISISDSGPGIPDKLKTKVFDAFYTSKEKGTGLGLSICLNLVNKLNGKIDITNRDVKGTTVTVTLPIEENNEDSCH
jgi:signal transduction histidine kinase